MYKIVRFYRDVPNRTIRKGLTLAEAQEHCSDPEASSRTATSYRARKRTEQLGRWFDGYAET